MTTADTAAPITASSTPLEVDTALAAAHRRYARAEMELGWSQDEVREAYYEANRSQFPTRPYRNRRGVKVWPIGCNAHDAAEWLRTLPADQRLYDLSKFLPWSSTPGKLLAAYDARFAKVEEIRLEIRRLDGFYTGWSRFYVVTSSAGHIHSTAGGCPSCRPTTTFGWLPQLSGKDQAAAIEELGPALCSVCFPLAPVELTGGKITKSRAAQLAEAAAAR